MTNFFYYDTNGQKYGPINDVQLKALVVRQIILPDTPMETDNGHTGKAGQIPGLFCVPPPAPRGNQTKYSIPIIIVGILVVVGSGVLFLLLSNGIGHKTAPAKFNNIEQMDKNTQSLDSVTKQSITPHKDLTSPTNKTSSGRNNEPPIEPNPFIDISPVSPSDEPDPFI